MDRNDFWIDHIQDNRIRGLLGELAEAIEDCEDADTLNRLRSSLGKGFTNFAASRERELRSASEIYGCSSDTWIETAHGLSCPACGSIVLDAKKLDAGWSTPMSCKCGGFSCAA
jgi:hypothetical protein